MTRFPGTRSNDPADPGSGGAAVRLHITQYNLGRHCASEMQRRAGVWIRKGTTASGSFELVVFWLKHSVIFIWLFTGLYSRVRRGHCRDVCEQGSKYAQIVSHVIIKSLLKTRHLEIHSRRGDTKRDSKFSTPVWPGRSAVPNIRRTVRSQYRCCHLPSFLDSRA